MAFSKSIQTALLAIQSVAANSVLISSAFDMSTRVGGLLFLRFGRRSASAAGASVNIRCEASHASSGDNSWYPFAVWSTSFAACEGEAVTGTVAAGQKVITVASTANLTAGDLIFIDNGTIANSEWARIKSIVSNTSVTVEDDLVNAATGATIYDGAEIFPPVIVPDAAYRIRAVIDGSGFTQAFAINANLTTIDSI